MTRLEIVSDVVCPWCYLGAASLMRAVTAREGHPVAIRWRPFRLDPTIPAEGMERGAYLTRKFGDPARIHVAGELERPARRLDGCEVDDAAFDLRHGLLRDHDDVTRVEPADTGSRVDEQRREIVSLLQLRDPRKRQDPHLARHGRPVTRSPACPR